MPSIQAIQQSSVHQIQSGQVIVDLNSVVKELVENSLDAGSTSIEVRFRDHGLDSIEVVDNGAGISPDDYEHVALKHHTSKLKNYDDLASLETFGFRGEALASLCALSQLHIVTCRDVDAPRGRRMEFEVSGKLKNTSIVAAQKGTKVVVEKLFGNLPVRRKELQKNIKREYGKVLTLLQAYACISIGVRFVVSNQPLKGSKTVAFSTAINSNTKDNITNVFGVKTLHALINLDLELEMQPSRPGFGFQAAPNSSGQAASATRHVTVEGHISRPVFGEGRQAPDRQMFFVNSRPCALPQVSKTFNDAYKQFNVSQSPFVFANIVLDTSAYDVNVSPDKRTILLHDQGVLLESLKEALLELFEAQNQSVPQANTWSAKPSSYKSSTVTRPPDSNAPAKSGTVTRATQSVMQSPTTLSRDGDQSSDLCTTEYSSPNDGPRVDDLPDDATQVHAQREQRERLDPDRTSRSTTDHGHVSMPAYGGRREIEQPSNIINAFDRMRPSRTPSQTARITIGDVTTRTVIGSSLRCKRRKIDTPETSAVGAGIRAFAMPGSRFADHDMLEADEDDETGQESEHEAENPGELDIAHEQTLPSIQRGGYSPTLISEGLLERPDAEGQPSKQLDTSNELPETAGTLAFQNSAAHRPERSTRHDSMGHGRRSRDQPFVEESSSENEYLDTDTGGDQHERHDEGVLDDDYAESNPRASAYITRADELKSVFRVASVQEAASGPSAKNLRRATTVMKHSIVSKYSTLNTKQNLDTSIDGLDSYRLLLTQCPPRGVFPVSTSQSEIVDDIERSDAEVQLSLAVSKSDFSRMRVAGQFNLGFIIALRPDDGRPGEDDLFIIDQHAADEKSNFERLSSSLILETQRLAQPKKLYLTAVDEEIVLDRTDALTANGFLIEIDTSGDLPVGQRCTLLSLPTSKETTFDLSDLEELLHILAENSSTSDIPRPSKVRKMLAMRACRSSIMVGKTLTHAQMQRVVSHLGDMDKPWNCPHGRPTMRHVAGLGGWQGWNERTSTWKDSEDLVRGGLPDWLDWLNKSGRRG